MKKNKEKYFDIDAVMVMAKEYGVDKNPLFIQTLKNYATIQSTIESINNVIESDSLTTIKEYVKGRENIYLHPAVKELTKQIDAANKTLDKMLDIIEKLGQKTTTGDELLDYITNQ